jgi:hypothetical protein
MIEKTHRLLLQEIINALYEIEHLPRSKDPLAKAVRQGQLFVVRRIRHIIKELPIPISEEAS